jgi:hypothetical protein
LGAGKKMKMNGKNKGYYKSEDENYETSWSSSPVLYRHKNIDASTLSFGITR